MKKVWKGIGLIAALLAMYYAAQLLVAIVIMIIRIVQIMMTSRSMPDVGQITEDVLRFVSGQTPWIIFAAVIITLPFYYLIYRKRKQEMHAFINLGALHPVGVPVLIVFGVALNFIVELFLALLQQLPALQQLFSNYDKLASTLMDGSFIMSLIAVGIAGPIFEELLFRGLVFGELRKITKVRVAIVLQALLFGVYHLNIVQGSYAFLIGLLLGFIYYRSKSIIAPILVHIAVNSSSVLISHLASSESLEKWGVAITVSCILLFILSGAFILTHRSFRHAMDNGLYDQNHQPDQPAPPQIGPQG